jgi:hypothetical protein
MMDVMMLVSSDKYDLELPFIVSCRVRLGTVSFSKVWCCKDQGEFIFIPFSPSFCSTGDCYTRYVLEICVAIS